MRHAFKGARWIGCTLSLLAPLASCTNQDVKGTPPSAEPPAASSALPSPSIAATKTLGDPEHGRALVAQFECSRCHDGTGTEEAKFEKQCFHCHEKILIGEFVGPKSSMKRWREVVDGLRDVPTLIASNKRLRRSWMTSFLVEPYDVRPRLAATMPRLPLDEAQARDIAAYLGAPDDAAASAPVDGDPARGRALMEAKGCPSCHAFSGVPPLKGAVSVKPKEKGLTPGLTLAPDLRTARDRLTRAALLGWIKSPIAMKPDTPMPAFALSEAEARDMVAYILTAELSPVEPRPIPARLPVLTRPVRFDEVSAKVFRKTCWHCHGEPDYSVGDGGPGNTGGFGFKPRGLSLVDYGTVASGLVDDQGERHSVFEPLSDNVSRLVGALLARHEEEAGKPRKEIRGMPLGLPALSPDDIQLVESWVAQGRPR